MKTIVVVLHKGQKFNNEFRENSPFIEDISYWPWMLKIQLEKLDYNLIEYDDEGNFSEASAFFHFGRYRKDILKKYVTHKHIYLGFEPVVVNADHSIRIISKLANQVYDAVFITHRGLCLKNVYEVDMPVDIKVLNNWKKEDLSQLACMFSGDKYAFGKELYSERRKIIEYAERNHIFDFKFFGPNWHKPYSDYACYGGVAEDKAQTAKPYKFIFCLENEFGMNGGVSEKIFDALTLGKVPIYYGASDISSYVPKQCFIDYSLFSSIDECFSYIRNMNDETYYKYIENIRNFMSDKNVVERYNAADFAEKIVNICKANWIVDKRKLHILDYCRLKQKIYGVLCEIRRGIKC